MARRSISTRGRVLAAGLCVGVTGLLAGLMAATDNTGSASADTSSPVTGPASQSVVGGQGPGGFDDRGSPGSTANGPSSNSNDQQPFFPQPDTRSGGS